MKKREKIIIILKSLYNIRDIDENKPIWAKRIRGFMRSGVAHIDGMYKLTPEGKASRGTIC